MYNEPTNENKKNVFGNYKKRKKNTDRFFKSIIIKISQRWRFFVSESVLISVRGEKVNEIAKIVALCERRAVYV